MERVDRVSNGQWRIFSKRGNGYSTSRLVGEIVTNAYLCLPDASMQGGGVEVSFSGKGSVPGDTSLIQVQTQVSTVNISCLQ